VFQPSRPLSEAANRAEAAEFVHTVSRVVFPWRATCDAIAARVDAHIDGCAHVAAARTSWTRTSTRTSRRSGSGPYRRPRYLVTNEGGAEMRAKLLSVMALVVVVAGCTPGPTRGGSTGGQPAPPFTCPDPGDHVVVVAGDSLGGAWPGYVSWPSGTVVINVSKGGASLGSSFTGNPPESYSIAERALAQLDVCGNDVGLLIVSGGVNDLAGGQDPQLLIDAAGSLNQQLELRGVPVAWIPIVPWALDPPLLSYDARYDHRLTFNRWLATPGSVSGSVLDCNTPLLLPGFPEEPLDPDFFSYLGLFQVDRFHPNSAGFAAYGACLGPLVSGVLDGP
jgi:lysophospholipase L1-like esterase